MAAPRSAKDLFHSALEFTDSRQRAEYLDRECGDDVALRQRLDALLHAHDHPESALERPLGAPAITVDHAGQSGSAGTVVAGRYKLLEAIGEGGMGEVWMAQQTEPVKRVVALKLIKAGMDSKQVIARFEAERQALALMDHANIARVLDAGTTSAGRPYFVMDLVKGVPITKYCDEHHLTPRQRLELFIPVCQAVQHAHQKGIIHRDLKPTNVLVALYDGKPVPKVIDFGVAKATGQQLTDKTLVTGFGSIVGTLEYMSPEQAEINQLDIDTRSDIYSLGVLLYELLAGSPPFSRKELEKAGMLEMLRVIREQEPSKPSTKLSSSDALPTLSANRGTEPAKLTRLVRGELDWIVMKALEKDRSRRYETANGFAMDVQRYLADESVQACPPSAGYRLRKFVRRNKGPVLAASLVMLTLLIGIVGTTVGLVRVEKARQDEAERAEGERRARLAAEKAEHAARESEADTKAFSEFLVNDVLAVARPAGERGGLGIHVTVRQALETAQLRIDARFKDRPRAEAVARHDLGVTFRLIGELQQAEPHLRRAVALRKEVLGHQHESTLESQNSLGVLLTALGKHVEAAPLLEETFKLLKAKLGPDHPKTLYSMVNLAKNYQVAGKLDLALPLYNEALELRTAKLGLAHPDTIDSMGHLANGYLAAKKLDLAMPLFQKALQLRRSNPDPDHTGTFIGMNNLASCFYAAGKFDLALALFQEALKQQTALLGPDHPNTITSMFNVASCYQATKKLELALPLYEEALKLQRARLTSDHPDTLMGINNLALAYREAGNLERALPLFQEAAAGIEKRQFVHEHAKEIVANLITCLARLKQLDGAEHWRRKWLAVVKENSGPESLEYTAELALLGANLWAQKKLADAETVLSECLKLQRAKLGSDHADTIAGMNNLALAYRDSGKQDQALQLFQEAAAGVEKRGFVHSHVNSIVYYLIESHERLKQYEQAEVWRRKWLAVAKERAGTESEWHAVELALLGANLQTQKKFADAETVLRECLAIRVKKLPDRWPTFSAQSLLGAALLGQEKYAEAEPLLLQGYEGMKKREAQIQDEIRVARLSEALERLVRLYDAWGKKDKADEWRKELEVRKGNEKK